MNVGFPPKCLNADSNWAGHFTLVFHGHPLTLTGRWPGRQPTYTTIAGLCIYLVSPSSKPLTMSTDLQWLLVRKWNSFQVKGGHGPAFSKEKVS